VLAHDFYISVKALEVCNVCTNRFLSRQIKTAGSRVYFVSEIALNFNVIDRSLLVYVTNDHSFSDREGLKRMHLLWLTPCHHGVTSVEVLTDVTAQVSLHDEPAAWVVGFVAFDV
jgi:hypothetical protein